jgi:GNAT superfamily N-acetyltransferase
MRLQDRAVVYRDLLPVIASAYPHADLWLERRLNDVLDAKADCFIARDARGLRAIVIQTPKGSGRLKLSTIWVAERARGRGLGARLLDRCHKVWHQHAIDEVWVTASPAAVQSVERVLIPRGFVVSAYDRGRYTPGHIETVLCWTPHTDICHDGRSHAHYRSGRRPVGAVAPAGMSGWDVTRPAELTGYGESVVVACAPLSQRGFGARRQYLFSRPPR